jgi:hypothetical protein
MRPGTPNRLLYSRFLDDEDEAALGGSDAGRGAGREGGGSGEADAAPVVTSASSG